MAPKISRTFRIPADLVDRFDRAAEALGIDKTQVVVEAIQKFVEKYEAGQLFDRELVYIDRIYVPELGLCEIHDGRGRRIPEGKTKLYRGIKALNNERKTEINGKPASYTIERAGISLDFKNRVAAVDFMKCWIGGLVEEEKITFSFVWEEEYEEDDFSSEIAIWPEDPQS